jgi:hypothetical protein
LETNPAPQPGAAASDKPKNRRLFERQPNTSNIAVEWIDATGVERNTTGRCVDISVTGLSFEASDCIEAGTLVQFEVPELRLMGNGTVRYATSTGPASGLQFPLARSNGTCTCK